MVADVIPHGSEGGDGYHVNLFAPHLPEVGQAGLIRKLLTEVAQDPPSGLMHYPSQIAERPLRAAAAEYMAAWHAVENERWPRLDSGIDARAFCVVEERRGRSGAGGRN